LEISQNQFSSISGGSVTPRSSIQDVSNLLRAWRGGDKAALDELIPRVYKELHRLAHLYMRRERAGHNLQTTALVNEAYIRLIDAREVDWQDRAHFFAISSNLMRRILVDFARTSGYQKRGGKAKKVTLDEDLVISPEPNADIIKLDDALRALSEFDPRKAKVVEMRFFGGLSVEETAEVLKVSPDTVKRDWRLAKVWLLNELLGQGRDETRTLAED
jgi:RNA polymerase sigma-70 factor (ECF subfamily)